MSLQLLYYIYSDCSKSCMSQGSEKPKRGPSLLLSRSCFFKTETFRTIFFSFQDIDRQSRERKSGERHHRRSRSRSRDRIQRRSPPRFGSQGPGRFPRESPPPRREPSPGKILSFTGLKFEKDAPRLDTIQHRFPLLLINEIHLNEGHIVQFLPI